MTQDAPQQGPPPGPAEQQVLDALNIGFKPISIQQVGPDGSEILGVLIFYVCPVCRGVVPVDQPDEPFPHQHRTYHVNLARLIDSLDASITMARGMLRREGD